LIQPMLEDPVSFLTGFGYYAYDSSRFYKSAHNTYLYYLYNLGSIGLILFLAVFIRILVTARSAIAYASAECKRHLFALVFGLIAFLVAIFFSIYNLSGYLLWAYLGVGMRIAMHALPSTSSVVAGATNGLSSAGPRDDNELAHSSHFPARRQH